MKKFFALMLALVLCLGAAAAVAEEAEIPAVEAEVSFEAQVVALGETGLVLQIPADWQVQEAPEGVLLYAITPDGSVSITVQTAAMDYDTLLQSLADAGCTDDMLAEVTVNDMYCLLYNASDLAAAMYTFLDDETVLAFGFNSLTKEAGDALGNIPVEIFGSLAAAE